MARDHQVPQFYLRNFQIPTQLGLIYSYKRNLEPKALSIRKVAQEEDFYDVSAVTLTLLAVDLEKGEVIARESISEAQGYGVDNLTATRTSLKEAIFRIPDAFIDKVVSSAR